MPVAEREIFKLVTQNYFFKQVHEEMLLPAILDILVDQIGVEPEDEKGVKYTRFLARCLNDVYSDCQEGCNVKQRVYYFSEEWHKNIFLRADEIGQKILIKSLSDEEKDTINTIDDINLSKMLVKAFTVYNCYIKRNWKGRCICPIDNYMDVLMIAFFFNPNILYWAIIQELERKNQDMYVIRAIRTCLELCDFTYQMAKEYNETNRGKVITKYTNFHHVRAIEDVVLQDDRSDVPNMTIVETLNDTGVTAMNHICIRMQGSVLGNRKLLKLIGRKNYRFLKRCCKDRASIQRVSA